VRAYAGAHTHYQKASICRRRCNRQCSEDEAALTYAPRGREGVAGGETMSLST
jgi:hypothetical protein